MADDHNDDNTLIIIPTYNRTETVSFIESLDVAKVIIKSARGRAIFESYNESNPKKFPNDDIDRKFISKLVLDAAMGVNPKLSVIDIKTLATKIRDTFKTEKEDYYYQKTKKGYRGVLFYLSKNEKWKISNIKKASKRKTEKIQFEMDVIQAKEFLDSNPCDINELDELETAWKKTYEMRHDDLLTIVTRTKKKSKKEKEILLPINEFFKNWPSLRSANGHKLIKLDFEMAFPNAENITTEKLDQLINKLMILNSKKKRNQIKWSTEINQLFNIIKNKENDTKNAAQILILAYLLPPHGRANAKNKTTVIDVAESMILRAKNADEMKILITRRSQNLKKLGKPFQPVLVVIGKSWSRIEEVLCCVTAEVKWISENIITGIDIIFKSFFTLDLEYPFESEVHWCIIANLIYKIENTTIHPEAVGVLMNLSAIDEEEVIDFLNEKNNDNDETPVSDDEELIDDIHNEQTSNINEKSAINNKIINEQKIINSNDKKNNNNDERPVSIDEELFDDDNNNIKNKQTLNINKKSSN